MDSSVWIAGMGFATTLLVAWLGARWRSKADVEATLMEARVRVYGECTVALYEYRRVNYNRAKARIGNLPEGQRETFRQESFRANTRARAAIGQAAIVAASDELAQRLDAVRAEIRKFSDASDSVDLESRWAELKPVLEDALGEVRNDLIPKRGA